MALNFSSSNGANGGIITPTPEALASIGNYVTIHGLIDTDGDRLLPDYYNELVERFGNQSIQGFLAKTGAEFPVKSDKIVWNEEARLHLYYEGLSYASSVVTWSEGGTGSTDHAIRVGNTVLVGDGSGNEYLAYVSAKAQAVSGTSDATITIEAFQTNEFTDLDSTGVYVRVVGSEFAKGTSGMSGSVETVSQEFENNPIIMKDYYEISGSDTAQIGWIKVDGGQESSTFAQDGWLWYLKSEMDTRKRFMDNIETYMLEAQPASSSLDASASVDGCEGVFYKLDKDAIVATGGFADGTWDDFVADIDALLKELDKQGNVQENLMFLNRDENLAIDNGLSLANSYGSGGQSFGAFNNSSDMALNLGFMSFHRGSYTFHKTDWKYLNDITGRSNFGNGTTANILGVMTPSGSMDVYDKGLGGTAKRPFIHIRYRASQTDNRKMKHWLTGSVGGVYTSKDDKMEVNYLTERCPVVQGPNNFAIFKRA